MDGGKNCLCGRPLPEGRRKWCLACHPPTTYSSKLTDYVPPPPPEYSYLDRQAQAAARGISYGQLMAWINEGHTLPPLLRSVRWPAGSKHKGEEQLGEPEECPPTPSTGTQHYSVNTRLSGISRGHSGPCMACGHKVPKDSMFTICARHGSGSFHTMGYYCQDCFDRWVESVLETQKKPDAQRAPGSQPTADD